MASMHCFSRKCLALSVLLVLSAPGASSWISGQTTRTPGQLPGLFPIQPQPPAAMRMSVEGNRVTAEIQDTPFQQVLAELAARTGIVFEVQTQDNQPVSMFFYNVALQEAIKRIVDGKNSIFYFGKDASGRSRIEFVRIFQKAHSSPQPSLRYIGTGAVTKTGDDSIDNPEEALQVLSGGGSVEARQKAVEVLAETKSEAALQALTKALEDPAPEVKVAAIEGLASLEARNALEKISLALKDPHPGVRQSAITAIALLGDAKNLRSLLPLEQDPDPSVAAAARIAIDKLSGHP